MSRRILCTGAAGFLGSYICELLVERGDKVTALDCLLDQVHPSGEWPDYLPDEVERIPQWVGDFSFERLSGFDAVIHLAARVGVGQSMDLPVEYVTANAVETASLVRKMSFAKVPRLVLASSMSVYGEGSATHGVSEDWPRNPRSVYATTKNAAEEIAMQLADYHGIDAVALRYFNIYGPRQQLSNPYTGLGAIFTRQIREGIRPTVFEDGTQLRDFIHVSDVARATVAALDAPGGEVYNIGTGVPTSVLRFAELLCEAHGSDLVPELTGHTRKGDIHSCFADTRKAKQMFGFETEVALADGIHSFAEMV